MIRAGAVAFVTGGGRGIGRAIARALAAAGARVAVGARSREQVESVAGEIASVGGQSLALICDVTSSSSVASAFARARAQFGGIEILVNNAGIAESAPFLKQEEEMWERTLAVNLTGTYRCTREALPDMIARGHGRIINIASIAGRVGQPYITAYSASKHGVLGLTRSLALELASRGITVNAICPGYVDTPLTEQSVARIVEKTGRSAPDARRALEMMSPQNRLIQPEEVALVAVFLAGDEANGITGQAINVDGGAVTA